MIHQPTKNVIDPIAVSICSAALNGIMANPNVTRATLTDSDGLKSLADIAVDVTGHVMAQLKKEFTISV